jgi:hypothetical protein
LPDNLRFSGVSSTGRTPPLPDHVSHTEKDCNCPSGSNDYCALKLLRCLSSERADSLCTVTGLDSHRAASLNWNRGKRLVHLPGSQPKDDDKAGSKRHERPGPAGLLRWPPLVGRDRTTKPVSAALTVGVRFH